MNRIGENIRRVCEEQGMTMMEAAEKAGVTPQAVWSWSRGAHQPTAITLYLFAQAIGRPMADFMQGVE